MLKIHDPDGDSVTVGDATAMLDEPGVSLVVRNLASNGAGEPDTGEVWLTTDQARDLAKGILAYAALVDLQSDYRA